jgi:predicted nucleic acid-binding protein
VASVAALLDAGPLYAYIDADDAHHVECLALLERHPGPLAVPVLVVAEVVYLVATRLGSEAEVRFLGDLANRAFVTIPVEADDWVRIAELVARYRDLPLGTVDASIIAAAERLDITTIATLDRRHFGVVRPGHIAVFELIP